MASIDKLPSGKWRVRVVGVGSKTFQTKAFAKAWGDTQERAKERGLVGEHTLLELLEAYAIRRPDEEVRINRFKTLEIARKLCSKVTMQDIEAWRDDRLERVKPASVRREMNTLSAAFNYGIKRLRWCLVNPVSYVDRPSGSPPRKKRWSDRDIEAYVLASGWPGQTIAARTGGMLLLAIETAMRAGEIEGLTWDRIEGSVAQLPKTKNGHERFVPLSAKALEVLAQVERDGDLVWGMTSSQRDAACRKIMIRAGLPDHHFHDTRREATTRLSKKVDVLQLAKITGHRDIKILLETYYAPDLQEIAESL